MRWRYIVIFLLVIVGADRLMSFPPSFLWSANAGNEACAVYRSFTRSVARAHPMFLRSGTTPWIGWKISLDGPPADPGDPAFSPREFQRENSTLGSSDAEKFTVDTSGYFRPLAAKQSLFIRRCFESDASASFFDGPPQWLDLRELLFGRSQTLWVVTPVGFSADGRHALLYAENVCYGWCGGGFFCLFEKRDNTWTLVGTSLVWIS